MAGLYKTLILINITIFILHYYFIIIFTVKYYTIYIQMVSVWEGDLLDSVGPSIGAFKTEQYV